MDAARTVRLTEGVAAMVERAAAALGVDAEEWVNERLTRDLTRDVFLEKLDDVQARNPEPLSEEEAAEVVYRP